MEISDQFSHNNFNIQQNTQISTIGYKSSDVMLMIDNHRRNIEQKKAFVFNQVKGL